MIGKRDATYVKNLRSIGDIESYFAISKIKIKKNKNDFKYLTFNLSDKTGVIPATYWSGDKTGEIKNSLDGDRIVKVRGSVTEFPEGSRKYNILINPQLGNYVNKCPETEYNLSEFIRVSNKDPNRSMKEILDTISDLEDRNLKRVLNAFFKDPTFNKEFSECPAAKMVHHHYIGGLLEHTTGVLTTCKAMCKVHPKLDKDLLLTSAILHDIGKLKTYNYDELTIEISEEGRFIEHLVIASNMIRDKIKELGDIPEDLSIKLLHLVLSHHGEVKKGWGSPVSPQIPEAFALHYADNLDAKVKKSVEEASIK